MAKSKNTSYYIWCAVSLCFMFLFRVIVPPFAGITPEGMTVLGVFFGVLIATVATGETFWPAVLGLFALVWGQFTKGSALLGTWFGDTTIQQIIWVMALTGAVTDSGAINVLARKMMKLKIMQGNGVRFLAIYFLLVMICAALVSSATTTILLFFPIVDSIAEVCDIKEDSDLKRELLLGTYISGMAAYVLPFKGIHLSSIALINGILEANGLSFNNGAYLITATLVVMLFVAGFIAFVRFVWKTDLTPLKNFSFEKMGIKEEDTKMNKRQIILLCAMLFAILFLLASMIIPKGSPILEYYNRIGNVWIWIIVFGVLSMCRDKDGKPFINGVKLLQSKTMWGIVAVAGCFTICGRAIASDDYGIKAAIAGALNPIMGNSSWPILVILCVVISTVFTNFTNGMPVSFTINSICIPIAVGLEQNGLVCASVLGVASILGGMCAFMTNGAIAYAPLLHGRKEITTKFMWTKGVVTNGIFIVVASLVCIVFGYVFA
ncbi:MAG: hypothetical protein ACI4PL_00025 [Faecousia sp.]